MASGIRAFSNPNYDYYKLMVDLEGLVPKGAIFVHDTDDSVRGSVAQGCLVLCWTPEGNCYCGSDGALVGGSVVFHAAFRKTPMFELTKASDTSKLEAIYSAIDRAKQQIADLEELVSEYAK